MDIVKEFNRSPFISNDININIENTAGPYHLRSIIHNEYLGNNNHSRIQYLKNASPEMKTIRVAGIEQHWFFIPTFKKYKYDEQHGFNLESVKKIHKKTSDLMRPYWQRISDIYSADRLANFIIDLRSFETRGPALLSVFTPFIKKEEIKIIESKNPLLTNKIYMGNQPPFLSIKEPVYSIEVSIINANIQFIVDRGFSKIKDIYFTTLLANLSSRYRIYGDMGDNIGYVFTQYKINPAVIKKYLEEQGLSTSLLVRDHEIIVRIPDVKIEMGSLLFNKISDDLKPYNK